MTGSFRQAVARLPFLRRQLTPVQRAILFCAAAGLLRIAIFPEPSAAGAASKQRAIVHSVTDGDTLLLTDGRRIRLLGIDAPEIAHHGQKGEAFGQESSGWLRQRLAGKPVLLEIQGRDHFGRHLAWVRTESGLLINQLSLAAGMSILLDDYGLPAGLESGLRIAEHRAQLQRLGIWSQPR